MNEQKGYRRVMKMPRKGVWREWPAFREGSCEASHTRAGMCSTLVLMMKSKAFRLTPIVALTCFLAWSGQVHGQDAAEDHSEFPDTTPIENLSNIEVWAGQIRKLHLEGINKRNVVSPIILSTAKLISPASDLSPFSKLCVDQLKPVTGKKNYFAETYLYYDEAGDFPDGKLPQVGEMWIFTCRRGIDGGLHLLSGARLEPSGKPDAKKP